MTPPATLAKLDLGGVWARSISFEVFGTPRPQGSGKLISANGRTFKKQDANFARWRNALVEAAVRAGDEVDWSPSEWPCRLEVEFLFAPPKSQTKWEREIPGRPKFNGPDLDKLVRAVGDALQAARLVSDDRIIVEHAASKRFIDVTTNEREGAKIKLIELWTREG